MTDKSYTLLISRRLHSRLGMQCINRRGLLSNSIHPHRWCNLWSPCMWSNWDCIGSTNCPLRSTRSCIKCRILYRWPKSIRHSRCTFLKKGRSIFRWPRCNQCRRERFLFIVNNTQNRCRRFRWPEGTGYIFLCAACTHQCMSRIRFRLYRYNSVGIFSNAGHRKNMKMGNTVRSNRQLLWPKGRKATFSYLFIFIIWL